MCENPNHLGRQEPTGCRQIYGDPATEDWHFCQRTIAPGGKPGDANNPPYCPWHRKVNMQATTEAARRNYLKFMERIAEGDAPWMYRHDYGVYTGVQAAFSTSAGITAAHAAHLAAESDNLIPVDVRIKVANRKGILHV